jgi:hypothetical protein
MAALTMASGGSGQFGRIAAFVKRTSFTLPWGTGWVASQISDVGFSLRAVMPMTMARWPVLSFTMVFAVMTPCTSVPSEDNFAARRTP